MSKTSKEDDVLANIFVCDKQDGAKGKAVSDIKKLIQEDKIKQLVRLMSVNVLRECAVQTHTDWERYVKKSEAIATNQIKQLIQEAKIEELKFIDDFLSEEYQHEFDTKKYCQSRIADLKKEIKRD